jgi:hypothetical protein
MNTTPTMEEYITYTSDNEWLCGRAHHFKDTNAFVYSSDLHGFVSVEDMLSWIASNAGELIGGCIYTTMEDVPSTRTIGKVFNDTPHAGIICDFRGIRISKSSDITPDEIEKISICINAVPLPPADDADKLSVLLGIF